MQYYVVELQPRVDKDQTILMLGQTMGFSQAHTRKEGHLTAEQSTKSTLLLELLTKVANLYVLQNAEGNKSFLWHKQLSYNTTAIYRLIWVNTQ